MEKFDKKMKVDWWIHVALTILAIICALITIRYIVVHWPGMGVWRIIFLVGFSVASTAFMMLSIKSYPFTGITKISSAYFERVANMIDGQACELVFMSQPYRGHDEIRNECVCDIVFLIEGKNYTMKGIGCTRIDKTIAVTKVFHFDAKRKKILAF